MKYYCVHLTLNLDTLYNPNKTNYLQIAGKKNEYKTNKNYKNTLFIVVHK